MRIKFIPENWKIVRDPELNPEPPPVCWPRNLKTPTFEETAIHLYTSREVVLEANMSRKQRQFISFLINLKMH